LKIGLIHDVVAAAGKQQGSLLLGERVVWVGL